MQMFIFYIKLDLALDTFTAGNVGQNPSFSAVIGTA